jgi:glucuronate isomerase
LAFLDQNYLLGNETAKRLYQHVKDLPIVDVHNHANIKEIAENKGWEDIWQVTGATDHYVWELMRRRGITEEKITGKATNKEKWMALAKVFPDFAGNPTYEWIHLNLNRRLGITQLISENTAKYIWEMAKIRLAESDMKPQRLLQNMNVEIMCTTNDPDEDLKYHRQVQEEISGVSIRPTWRPDKLMAIGNEGWADIVRNFGEKMNIEIDDLEAFLTALQKSHDKFGEVGCVASDHAIQQPVSYFVKQDKVNKIFKKAINGGVLTNTDIKDFTAFMLIQLGKMNQASNWVIQLHIGAMRDYRSSIYRSLGPDSGGDVGNNNIEVVESLRYFFNQFDERLKVVCYYIDNSILLSLATIARVFPNVNLAAPWWFNDSPYGMEGQLKYIATIDLLRNHLGMVTDSRKLMSYESRTEMFRRVLSNVLGDMTEKGQIPEKVSFDLSESVCYYRALEYFFGK